MPYPGWPSLCLATRNLQASKLFYSQLGMQVVEEVADTRIVLRLGSFHLALMPFLEATLINFRGGDVFATHQHLKSVLPELEGEPERYAPEQYDATASGECWATRDPGGNPVFFDTNETEAGKHYLQSRASDILRNAATELEALGVDPEVVRALKNDALARLEAGAH